jgi:hypothetical protein
MTDSALAALLFLQLTCILAACRAFGISLIRERTAQPAVEPWLAADRAP